MPLSVGRSYASLAVLLIADPFHPIDVPAIKRFRNGEVRHALGGGSPMPVLDSRRRPDHIAGHSSFGTNKRSTRTAPVKYCSAPLFDGCAPLRVMTIAEEGPFDDGDDREEVGSFASTRTQASTQSNVVIAASSLM